MGYIEGRLWQGGSAEMTKVMRSVLYFFPMSIGFHSRFDLELSPQIC